MKISRHMTGTPITADYEMLRAALVAIQTATPTARAAQAIHSVEDDFAALLGLLSATTADDADAVVLGHRFARHLPFGEDAEPIAAHGDQRLYRGAQSFVERPRLHPDDSERGGARPTDQGSR